MEPHHDDGIGFQRIGLVARQAAFIGESGPATERVKRVGVMDYDGAGIKWLTSKDDLVLSPRFAPDGQTVLYTSFASGVPQIMSLDVDTVTSTALTHDPRAPGLLAELEHVSARPIAAPLPGQGGLIPGQEASGYEASGYAGWGHAAPPSAA